MPSRQQLKSLISTALSFHYLATEEIIVNNLLSRGQEFINEEKWAEAIVAYEDAEKMERWSEIYGTQIFSSLALAHAHTGNITKAKHFMQLYKECFAGVSQSLDTKNLSLQQMSAVDGDQEESQKIRKASEIVMSHLTLKQQQSLSS